MAQLLDYTPQLRAQVQAELDLLLAGLERRDHIARQLEISLVWNLRVSPSAASLRDIAAATLDIALWVFCLDDYEGEDYDDFFDDCLATLGGDRSGTMRPILAIFARHREQMSARGRPMDRYFRSRRDIADAYRRRNRLARGELSADFDEYLAWRRSLIGTRVWLSAWELIGDFYLPESTYEDTRIANALDLLIHGQILENEIHSLARDRKAGTPNLVVMHAREQGSTIEDSTRHLLDRFRANEQALRAAISTAQQALSNDPKIAALLQMIELCLEGSASLYQLDLSRYQAP